MVISFTREHELARDLRSGRTARVLGHWERFCGSSGPGMSAN